MKEFLEALLAVLLWTIAIVTGVFLAVLAIVVGVIAVVVWIVCRGIWLSAYYLAHPHPDYGDHLL